MTCFILISTFVQHELSYDGFHARADPILRVVERQPGNVFRGSDRFAATAAPLAAALRTDFPEVTDATTANGRSVLLTWGTTATRRRL
ncbi:MAG: hypothetical protein AB1505_21800 [Candidatus Latescibacterota bacterium]